ncbi:MAG: hypothetical protein WBQ38_16275 [Ignavibacteria bacterium]|nr:hypothetical protein [Ignavibacteria bacterium]MBL0106881.1 hypothetical protein [Ignavibacteria bacterium]
MQEKFNKILIIGIIVICGCGLFDSRSVEPPSEPRSTYLQPTSPDIVITNLNFAIAEKNLDNYLRCFTDSNFSQRRFRYFPDAISLSSYPVFQTWSLTNERNYYSNLISFTNTNSSSNLFLSNTTFNSGIDSAIVDSDYILIFDHNKQNVAKIAKGKLRFIMGVDSRSLWSVHGWYDFINQNNDTTWSVIKANFAN